MDVLRVFVKDYHADATVRSTVSMVCGYACLCVYHHLFSPTTYIRICRQDALLCTLHLAGTSQEL